MNITQEQPEEFKKPSNQNAYCNMTFKTRIIKLTKDKARIGDIYTIDLSKVPASMTFDEYLESDLFKKEREKLFSNLADREIETKYLDMGLSIKVKDKITYVLEDDVKREKEA